MSNIWEYDTLRIRFGNTELPIKIQTGYFDYDGSFCFAPSHDSLVYPWFEGVEWSISFVNLEGRTYAEMTSDDYDITIQAGLYLLIPKPMSAT